MSDSDKFWEDMALLRELRNVIDNISPKDDVNSLLKRSANTIERLRNEMIDPAEYMRVSNERGRLMGELIALQEKSRKAQ